MREPHDDEDLFVPDDLLFQTEDTTEDSHSLTVEDVYSSVTEEEFNFLAHCDTCGGFL